LTFNPDSKQDYKFEITVQTEREKFMLPVICHGSRIEIQIPEMLDFGSTPVK
jgi:hydrocephalus-inducing protein